MFIIIYDGDGDTVTDHTDDDYYDDDYYDYFQKIFNDGYEECCEDETKPEFNDEELELGGFFLCLFIW